MLRLRILTALVLIPVFVLGVLYLQMNYYAMLMGSVIVLAAWEWAVIAGFTSVRSRIVYVLGIIILMLTIFLFRSPILAAFMNLSALIFWFAALWMIIKYQRSEGESFRLPLSTALIGLIVLLSPWLNLLQLRADEPGGTKQVLFLFVLVWAADIAAYFCGRRWGKQKLCDRVSPGKSREGVYGALLAAIVLALLVALQQQYGWDDALIFIIICLITVLASVLGDLLESLMKRLGNVKDSGAILPGHGGVLDRIDSLTAALPVYVSALWLWEYAS